MIALGLLFAAATGLLAAILRRDEKRLLAAVLGYAGVTVFLVETAPAMILPAMMLAIALAALGLARFLTDDPTAA